MYILAGLVDPADLLAAACSEDCLPASDVKKSCYGSPCCGRCVCTVLLRRNPVSLHAELPTLCEKKRI